ncbi:mRNA processing protein, putative, partial [Eimeria tenella]
MPLLQGPRPLVSPQQGPPVQSVGAPQQQPAAAAAAAAAARPAEAAGGLPANRPQPSHPAWEVPPAAAALVDEVVKVPSMLS